MPELSGSRNRKARSSPAGATAEPYVVIFDGGSLGNPRKGYGSYLLVSPTGREVHRELDFSAEHPMMTNNQAEYRTLIEALRNLRQLLAERSSSSSVRVEGDSQLVLNQLGGTWKVKNEGLRALHAEAKEALAAFGSVEFRWHPRQRSVDILGH